MLPARSFNPHLFLLLLLVLMQTLSLLLNLLPDRYQRHFHPDLALVLNMSQRFIKNLSINLKKGIEKRDVSR
jgi:hypothetical protein